MTDKVTQGGHTVIYAYKERRMQLSVLTKDEEYVQGTTHTVIYAHKERLIWLSLFNMND